MTTTEPTAAERAAMDRAERKYQNKMAKVFAAETRRRQRQAERDAAREAEATK